MNKITIETTLEELKELFEKKEEQKWHSFFGIFEFDAEGLRNFWDLNNEIF